MFAPVRHSLGDGGWFVRFAVKNPCLCLSFVDYALFCANQVSVGIVPWRVRVVRVFRG